MIMICVFRSEGSQHAEGHLASDDSTRVFCGRGIPRPVLEGAPGGLTDPRNPYTGKSHATCRDCLSEWHNGRTSGYRTETTNEQA